MRILLLEDDQFICEQIKTYFELNDHFVDIFYDGETLLQNAILEQYDIFLLDINTPKKNGLDTLKQIRLDGIETPAIFLTAMNSLDDIKLGYDAGCNDYVRKPFDLEEVELRIMQLVLRSTQKIIKITDNYSFDIGTMELFYNDKTVNLNQKEKSIIYLLLKNKGSTVSPTIIKDYVWNELDVCDNTLRTQIKKLRAKLKENFIQNIRNSGYIIK